MKLYVIELLRQDGKPYRKPRFDADGMDTQMLHEASMFKTSDNAHELFDFYKVPCQRYRIRTLALLPVEDE